MIFATNVENIPIEGKIPNFILLVQNLNVVCMKSINNYRKNQHNSIIMRNIKQINHNYIVYSTFIVHRQTDGNGHPERNPAIWPSLKEISSSQPMMKRNVFKRSIIMQDIGTK